MTDRSTTRRARWARVGLVLSLNTVPAFAQPGEWVAACDTLVSLRILNGAAPDRDAALARVAGQPGCKAILRADVGAVEHRAMIGGAPFECLTVKAEAACLWVRP